MSEPTDPGTCAPAPGTGPVHDCDLLVVGGGVNGAGIARDAAGRGLSVVLCERDDLASHTSSASTKLIHGGLRYLEHREFGLVRKALQERERLLCSAPHIMWPLRFVMPHDPSMRPAWLIRAGLFLYDHLARRAFLPGSETVPLDRHPAGEGLAPGYRQGFAYSDGWVDDARLVVLCARDAADRGATVLTRTACEAAHRVDGRWVATLRGADGRARTVRARALVNATGPWAASFLAEGLSQPPSRALRLVRGSHVVLPRLFPHEYAYILQNADRRIVFAIPYEGDFTLVGTTDVEHHGAPGDARIAVDEMDYLCAVVERAFGRHVTRSDVVWHYSGVRPLLDDAQGDPSAVTRDYALDLDAAAGAPLLSVWGGKITTFRKLAEEVVDQLLPALDERRPAWTADAVLPGGDLGSDGERSSLPEADFGRFLQSVQVRHPWLPADLAHRWSRAYGSRLGRVVGTAQSLAALGEEVAPGLYEAELDHLVREEWATDADDVLWRRSKLGLRLSAAQRDAVARWMTGAGARRFGGTSGAR